jgi:SAM-dependent methyltransferase
MIKILSMKDLFGKALLDYQNGNYTVDIITSTSISDEDVLPLPYLFRSYSEMPRLEQKALDLAKGIVLDIGCGAGSHSLYLQEKAFDVKAIDISKGAIEVCKKRGIINTELKNILDETSTFDTILLLMNGTGVFEDLETMPKYLRHLKKLMKPNAQTLIDSSDIKYMYDDDGSYWMDANANYYGELDYYVSYKAEDEEAFKMLYLDFETLKSVCNSVGLQCDLVLKGEHFDYLARITVCE